MYRHLATVEKKSRYSSDFRGELAAKSIEDFGESLEIIIDSTRTSRALIVVSNLLAMIGIIKGFLPRLYSNSRIHLTF